ncbi:MAG: DUF4440 domain-containing protein [Hyphomicrobiaceae bacterium]|nr:DUF4440 domain-containing protein [Hyphomicrobiaceae bacterium]
MTEEAAHLRRLEERLLQADARRPPDVVRELLADDFVEVGSEGVVSNRDQIVKWLSQEAVYERVLQDFHARKLAADVFLVTYRSVRRDPATGRERHSRRCSIWTRIDGRWQMVYHQGTAAGSGDWA